MSALTDLFTSMANKIRSKVGGSQTYTPLQMVSAIDDVYNAGAASVPSPSSITPSNASPVSLTADNAVKPTTSGYAIASYSSVTPSDASPVTLTSGDIVKLGGNGKAVANVNSITPSSSAPSMSSGSIYKAGGSGYAIDTYSSITPSTSGTYFASGFRKMSSSGYAYSQKPLGAPDYFYTYYGSSNTTLTFSDAMSYVYISFTRNSATSWGTYAGNGTVTQMSESVQYHGMIKITNVSAGDTFKPPGATISGSVRYIMSVVGKKA